MPTYRAGNRIRRLWADCQGADWEKDINNNIKHKWNKVASLCWPIEWLVKMRCVVWNIDPRNFQLHWKNNIYSGFPLNALGFLFRFFQVGPVHTAVCLFLSLTTCGHLFLKHTISALLKLAFAFAGSFDLEFMSVSLLFWHCQNRKLFSRDPALSSYVTQTWLMFQDAADEVPSLRPPGSERVSWWISFYDPWWGDPCHSTLKPSYRDVTFLCWSKAAKI